MIAMALCVDKNWGVLMNNDAVWQNEDNDDRFFEDGLSSRSPKLQQRAFPIWNQNFQGTTKK